MYLRGLSSALKKNLNKYSQKLFHIITTKRKKVIHGHITLFLYPAPVFKGGIVFEHSQLLDLNQTWSNLEKAQKQGKRVS